MSNPEKRVFNNQEHFGGQSSDDALGTRASFAYSQALDHRTKPSQLTVLPGQRKLRDVNDLVLNIIQTNSGNRYAIGSQGNIYKIATDNTVTHINKLPTGSDGALYRSDSDACYFATQTDIRRLYPMSGTPTFDQTYGASKSIDAAAYSVGGTATYSIPTAINENQVCYFTPDIEPFYSIKVTVQTKGTGDLTLTLHDGLNNVLASSTVTAANVRVGQIEFVFSSQIRAFVKPNARTYHFHLTSTVNDSKVVAPYDETMNGIDFELWAYRLVQSNNGFHPMAQFQQFNLIGHGNYLAVWEPLTESNPPNNEFQRHRLVFPAGYEVCGITTTDEFAVIACERYSTNATKDFQDGKLFIWDGVSRGYNQFVNVDGGSPSGIQSNDNYPFFIVNGVLCAWPGGKNIIKVRTIANTDTSFSGVVDSTRVYPNMLTVRDSMLHLGYPSITNNTRIEHGVYIWGSLDKNYPSSFNYAYVSSAQEKLNTSGNLEIGCVRNFGDEMYISHRYADGSYGLEIVDNMCTPAPVFKYRARRFDAKAVYKEKMAQKIGIYTDPLPENVSITPVYQIDSRDEQTMTDYAMTEDDTQTVAVIKDTAGNNFRRISYGFDGTSSGTETPVVYEAGALEWNPYIERKAL